MSLLAKTKSDTAKRLRGRCSR